MTAPPKCWGGDSGDWCAGTVVTDIGLCRHHAWDILGEQLKRQDEDPTTINGHPTSPQLDA